MLIILWLDRESHFRRCMLTNSEVKCQNVSLPFTNGSPKVSMLMVEEKEENIGILCIFVWNYLQNKITEKRMLCSVVCTLRPNQLLPRSSKTGSNSTHPFLPFADWESPAPPLRWLTMLFFALQTNLLLTFPLCSPTSSSDISRPDGPRRQWHQTKPIMGSGTGVSR